MTDLHPEGLWKGKCQKDVSSGLSKAGMPYMTFRFETPVGHVFVSFTGAPTALIFAKRYLKEYPHQQIKVKHLVKDAKVYAAGAIVLEKELDL